MSATTATPPPTTTTSTTITPASDDTPPAIVSKPSWRVRDAADNLLARRGLRSTSVSDDAARATRADGGVDSDNNNNNNRGSTDAPGMTLSKYFDVDTCQARLRRDKTPTVRMALDAAASAILENLHKADDDDGGYDDDDDDPILPPVLADVAVLQEMRVNSMERAHANKDLAKRRVAVAKEQEREKHRLLQKAERNTKKPGSKQSEKSSQGGASPPPDNNNASSSRHSLGKSKGKNAESTPRSKAVDRPDEACGAGSSNAVSPGDEAFLSSSSLSINTEGGSGRSSKTTGGTTPTKGGATTTNRVRFKNSNSSSPRKATAPSSLSSSQAAAPPPKFTRNTPASSASALEARLTGSRAILCTAANVAFDSLTPALPEWEVVDVADVPQNPSSNRSRNDSGSDNDNDDNNDGAMVVDEAQLFDDKPKTATVPNMGPVIIEAQMLGHRIENVATNAVKRSRRRFRFRKDNVRYRNNNNKRDAGFRILKNPFSWNDDEDDGDGDGEGFGSGGSFRMEVDENASIVTADNYSLMGSHGRESEAWEKVCIPRLLSILQTGIGNAIIHDVMWSTRHGRIANLFQEISMMAKNDDTTPASNGGIGKIKDDDPNFGPHLIVTVEPDVDRFAREFKAVNSHLRLMSTVDERSLRALPYKGNTEERRRLRMQFPRATGLPDAPFHVIVASYADFLTDYIHFCQTPFEVVLMDDGVSWMAAAHNDPNSPIATVWEEALFSKNDHQMGLAGTFHKDWDYGKDDEIDEEVLKEAWIGLTARHRLVTSSKLRVENPRSPADLLPISGLLSFALPHFADAVREEWDRSRIGNDAASMSHFRKLLTRSLVVHDPHTEADEQSTCELAMRTLQGDMPESIRRKDDAPVPNEISDERFIADGKVASSRRSALQWLGFVEDSWLRYELGSVSFEPILAAMKASLMYGHICEEITTASSVSTGATGQIIGNLAFKLAIRCGKCFGSEQGLRQHHSTHHAPPGTWLCRNCKADCVTSQARTHHERSCGQPSAAGGSSNFSSATSSSGSSKKDTGKKKGKAAKGGSAATKEEKDADGSVRVPSYRGVWVDQAGKYFIKIKSERVSGEGKKTLVFESIDEAAKQYDGLVKSKDGGGDGAKTEYNFKPNGTRIVYEDAPTSTTTGLGGGVVPALSVINIKDLPPDVKPLLRDPRQTSRTGGNSKRHVYAYRGVCRQARKGHDRWQSQISFLGVNHYLGTFDSEWDAAAIYAWAHLILYGEEATRQAQKEGEEAAAAYEQEKKDIAAGKIPAAPPKPDKKSKQAAKKKTDDEKAAAKKGKKDTKKEDKTAAGKRKPGRPKKKADEASSKQAPGKRLKAAAGKEDLAPILAQSVGKATILAPMPKFANMGDEELAREAVVRMVAARSVNYCITEVPLPAPIHMDFRPCVPRREGLDDQMGGALLLGIDPSLFGWNVNSIIGQQYFGSAGERRTAAAALEEEFGEDGLNQYFRSLVQGSTTVIGCASSRMQRVYASLGMGSPPMGGPIGTIDCNTGGNSKCCSEAAACIRYVPTDTGEFQLSALSSDLITMNGQRITPEMGSFPLFNEDVCTIGSRVFLFLLPSDT